MPVPALLLVPAGAMLAVLPGCADLCANQIVSQVSSPSGRHRAVLFQRDCGATTGFSTQISVLDAEEALAGSGNAFVADDYRGQAETGPWGGPLAEMHWRSADQLVIRYAEGSRLFHRSGQVAGVAISYVPVAGMAD